MEDKITNEADGKEEVTSFPKFVNGKFLNPEDWGFNEKKISDILKWKLWERPASLPSLKEIEERLPVLTPDKNQLEQFHQQDDVKHGVQTTWIGHSTFLVQMEGINILTDPVFYDRCSPIPFLGPKRYRPPSLTLEQLPEIHSVVVSHDHYDHLDIGAIQYLAKNSPDTDYFVCKGMKEWFKDRGIKEEKIHELTWWESYPYSEDLKMVCTPCQHWTKRNLTNTCKALWSSWSLIGTNNKVFFAGDTAYCPAFKEVGQLFGPFDVGLIPIGAYCPRWFMKAAHINPKEAVKIHKDLQCKKSIGMHWGTFVLTDEHIFEPAEKLELAKEKLDVGKDEFVTVFHGQTCVWKEGQDILVKEK